jgi:hypothetical protein
MKKTMILLGLVFFVCGLSSSFAQSTTVYPIPSFNFQMNEPEVTFFEVKNVSTTYREKRDMEVVVNTRSTSSNSFFATVFVFKVNPMKILGPYIVFSGQQLTVPIDNAKWGVRVKSDHAAEVDVWTD